MVLDIEHPRETADMESYSIETHLCLATLINSVVK